MSNTMTVTQYEVAVSATSTSLVIADASRKFLKWMVVGAGPGYAAAVLAQAQATQIYAVSAGCASAIIGGFQSSALGAVYTYPSGQTDQANLVGLVAGGIGGKFWCADASGNWGYVAHTAPQILKVLQDGIAAKEALVVQNSVLAAQISAATTITAVQAIVWTLPS
jgi:hypothetical protein